jgi:hypothetical protein
MAQSHRQSHGIVRGGIGVNQEVAHADSPA